MPDDKIKISALPSALTFNNTDEFAIVQDNGGSKTTKKGTVQGLGSHIAETMNFSSELDTDSNSIIGAINEAASDKNLAEPYSNTSFYIPGQYCIYNTVLYKCTTAAAFEDFDPTKWDEVLITEELGGDVSSKMDKANPTGTGSLAVGSSVSASGNNSTALGTSNTASGDDSHAEGFVTTASGLAAHAENDHTTASGASSHAEGYGTIANHASQHVFGECNVADPSSAAATARGNFVEIVGNGANTNDRSNARTLSWDGTETLAADLVFNNATTPQSLTSELQNRYTKAQVDAIIDSILPTDEASGAVAFFKTSLEKQLVSIDVDNSATKIYQFGFNLFDKTTTINDAYISDTDGSQKAATGSKCTDYIPIVGDTEFYIRTDQTQGAWGAFYDENKTFISAWTGYTPVGSYKTKTSPANARFARFTIVRNNSGDENTFCFSVSGSDNGQYKAYNPNSNVYLVANKDDIVTFEGYNTIFADNGNVDVFFKCSVVDYVNAHASSGNRSLGVSLSKGAGNGEDPEELDEKTLIDDEEESGEIKPTSKK